MTKYKREDFQIGQEVVVAIVDSTYSPLKSYRLGEVTKIGRKFIYVDNRKFDFDGEQVVEYSHSNKLFLSVEDFEKAKMYQDVLNDARFFFGDYQKVSKLLTVEDLQTLSEMMSNAEKRRKEELEKK